MSCGLIIGVDGGGSHTVAVAARADGTVVASAHGPGINYYKIGMDRTRENLYGVVEALRAKCDGADYDALCIGMSALDAPAGPETIRALAGDRFAADKIEMQSDAYIALTGFTLGKPGMIVICGTGSILMLRDASGACHVSGGWGHRLFDAGSAYAIAVDGLRAATDAWEGLASPTALCEDAMRFFALSRPRELIEKLYAPDCTPEQVAYFAKDVLASARQGDASAAAIITRHVEHLADQAALLMAQHPDVRKVGLYGGVFLHNAPVREAFAQALRKRTEAVRIELPAYPPEIGALIHCLMKRGRFDDAVLARIDESSRGIVQSRIQEERETV